MGAQLIAGALGALALVALGWFGGVRSEQASQDREKLAITQTRDAARQGTAEAIAKIKVTNTVINKKVEREILTDTVYRDCRVPAAGVQIANDALTGRPSGGTAGVPSGATDVGK